MSRSPVNRGAPTGRRSPFGPLEVLLLSAWCGLASGELEVAARVAYRALSATNKLYLMTRHFVWLVPLLSLMLFVLIGTVLALGLRIWPRQVGWLAPRLLVVLTL